MSDARAEWAFAVREERLRDLADAVLVPQPPTGAVVFGPAGSGKTRLARELARRAHADGVPAFTATATRATQHTPYGALAGLVAGQVPGTVGHRDVTLLYGALAAAMRPPGSPAPVLVVDDGQHLDAGTAALVLHLAQTATARVVVTVRSGEDPPEPITSLWKDEITARIDLDALSEHEVGVLVESGLGGELADDTRSLLARLSGGNVLYVRELVRAGITAGSLARSDGVWRWDGPLVVAPRLADTVEQRLGTMTTTEREALAVLAIGEPLPIEVARAVAGGEVLAGLEIAGLADVVTADDGRTRCVPAHPLYGEVVLAGLGRLRRDDLTRRIVAAWHDTDVEPAERLRLTTWRLDLDSEISGPELVAAAETAAGLFDFALAARLASAARARVGSPDAASGAPAGGAGTASPALRAVLVLARSLVARNDFAAAERLLAAAEDDLVRVPDRTLRQRYLDTRHDALYMGLLRREETLAMLTRFDEAQPPADRAWAATCTAPLRSEVLLDDGRLREVIDLNAAVLAMPDPSPLTLLPALEKTGEAAVYLGFMRQARGVHERLESLAATGRPEVLRGAANALLQTAMRRHAEGALGESLDLVDSLAAMAVQIPDAHQRGLIALCRGGFHLYAGRARTAHRSLLDAVDLLRRHDSGHACFWALTMLARSALLLGDHDGARARWREAEGRRAPRIARMVEDVAMTEAWLRAAAGDQTGAAQALLDAQASIPEVTVPRVRLLHLAGLLGAPIARTRHQISALVATTECAHLEIFADHLAALSADDGDALAGVADRFDSSGQLLRSAEAWQHAALAYDRAGRTGPAAHAHERSRDLEARCEGARSPLLRTVRVTLPDLSRREAEVARLVAAGLSNTEVAERLTVSVRTVESHLYRVFGKLGIAGRRELVDLLAEQPVPETR